MDLAIKGGVSVLIEKNTEYVTHATLQDTEGKWIIVDFTIKSL